MPTPDERDVTLPRTLCLNGTDDACQVLLPGGPVTVAGTVVQPRATLFYLTLPAYPGVIARLCGIL